MIGAFCALLLHVHQLSQIIQETPRYGTNLPVCHLGPQSPSENPILSFSA